MSRDLKIFRNFCVFWKYDPSQTVATADNFECVCVCLCVLVTCSWALYKWLNRSRCRLGTDSCGPKDPCVRWGRDAPRKGQFWGFSGPLKSIGSLCCGVRSKRIIQSPISARELDCCSRLQYSRLVDVITLSAWKIGPSATRPFVKILRPLVVIIITIIITIKRWRELAIFIKEEVLNVPFFEWLFGR